MPIASQIAKLALEGKFGAGNDEAGRREIMRMLVQVLNYLWPRDARNTARTLAFPRGSMNLGGPAAIGTPGNDRQHARAQARH